MNKNKLKPEEFEEKWRQRWLKDSIYQPDMKSANTSTSLSAGPSTRFARSGRASKEARKDSPFYNLMMFPYPSAEGLHVGNVYAFTGADIYGRFQRMQGNDVFEPIGLDGFGIHSENYAIKVGRHPKEQAQISEKNFYRQLLSIGNGFAWENRLETYDPAYYKWTQWIFVQMFKKGLAYRKRSPVNFCPKDKTVLSDEQVIEGRCERCGTVVVKKDMEQWFFRITKYAEKLLQNTYKPEFKWPEKVIIGQRNWIGKKEGINITYPIIYGGPATRDKTSSYGFITCFTTRPDTNYGATFVVIAPEHPFVAELINPKSKMQKSKLEEIKNYIEKTKSKSQQDRIAEGRAKTGVFTGFYALNQLNNYKMPIYISDFVLMEFGTGAVVGVPGHDKRDFEFAKVFDLPVVRVVVGKDRNKGPITAIEEVQEEEGTMINSGFLNGKNIHEATNLIMDYMEEKGWGKRVTAYRLRDWCISRQRYWGAPIPMINCTKCGWQAVPEKDLPVLLPDLRDWKPEGTGRGPLAKLSDWVRVKCPKCNGEADRETDVCDTFLDSSWYFLRYPSTRSARSGQVPWEPEITKKWLPVNMYIGGAEHTVLHLLYARFVTMVLKDLGFLDFEEPFSRFYAHGLIIAEGAKMSKSRGNVIVPDEYIRLYGADTLRCYLMFLGPFEAGGDFRDTGIAGMYRFLGRVWRLVNDHLSSTSAKDDTARLNNLMHKTIKYVTSDTANLRYNTAISHIMEYVNGLTEGAKYITKDHLRVLVQLIAPYAPFLSEELWERLGEKYSVHKSVWPVFNEAMTKEEMISFVIQVNGKVREVVKVKSQRSKVRSEMEQLARNSERVKKYLGGQTVKKTIFVPGKLLNFVV